MRPASAAGRSVRVAALLVLSLATVAVGAGHPARAHLEDQAVFRSGVSAVRLDVLVVRDGRAVPGLTSDDFEVLDNGVRQEVQAVWAERLPLDVAFVLDRSSSVAGDELARLKAAVRATLDTLRDTDRAALLTFAHTVTLHSPIGSDTTALASALDKVSAGGATCAIDAVHAALSMSHGSGRRTVVLLYSDGFDNRSWLGPEDIVQAARESEAVIYSVAFVPPSRSRGFPKLLPPSVGLLRTLSEESGGEVFTAREGGEIASSFARVLETMRARYLLTYTPRDGERRGWHELKVKLRRGGGNLVVRSGYHVR